MRSTTVLDDRRRMDQVAERLAELRERRALTLREMAQMSGVAADTINQIELGHRKARPSTLRKLARALEIDVQEFYAEPALPKAEAPETGQDVAEQAGFLEGIAAAVDSAADRLQTRLEETSRTDGNALIALLEDGWLEHRGAQQLLAEAEEEAAQKRREAPAVRRARAKLAQAVTRLADISDEMSATVLGDPGELEWTEEPTGVVVSLAEEYRSRRAAG
jgi:DNA-binding XRE family transcriptional regulator